VKSDTISQFPTPTNLIKQLLNFMELGRNLTAAHLPDSSIQKLICNSFAVLIEASLHDHNFWELIKQNTQFDRIIFSLLLGESRQPIRKEAADNITVICGSSKSRKKSVKAGNDDAEGLGVPDNPTAVDMLATFWEAFVQTFPRTPEYASQSQEFFEVALCVFRSVAEKSPSDLIFEEYLVRWSEIVLNHETEEVCSELQICLWSQC
jgi:ubiquitin carboxyl-terminal hydrolase 34